MHLHEAVATVLAPSRTTTPSGTTIDTVDANMDKLYQVLHSALALMGLMIVVTLILTVCRAMQNSYWMEPAPRRSDVEPKYDTPRTWTQIDLVHETTLSTWRAHRHDDLHLKLSHLLLQDLQDPDVAAAARALAHADTCRTTHAPQPGPDLERTAYWQAVTDAKTKVDAAIAKAKRVGTRRLPAEEAARIEEAQTLLARALDAAAYPAERATCYARVIKLIDGIVDDPQPALTALATGAGITAITAGEQK